MPCTEIIPSHIDDVAMHGAYFMLNLIQANDFNFIKTYASWLNTQSYLVDAFANH